VIVPDQPGLAAARSALQVQVEQLAAQGDFEALAELVAALTQDPTATSLVARTLHQLGAAEALEHVVNATAIADWPPGSGLLLQARQLDGIGEWQVSQALLDENSLGDSRAPPVVASPTPTTLMFRNIPLLESLVAMVADAVATAGGDRRVSIHVGAVSAGAEVYSLAIALDSAGLLGRVALSASDVRADLIDSARQGLVDRIDYQRFPPLLRARYLVETDGGWRIADAVREAIDFSVIDLLAPVADQCRYDLVIANNVLVHFPDPFKRTMLRSLAARMRTEAVLCIGGLHNGALVDELTALDLHPVTARVRDIYDAWTIQRDAWYRLPRQYWTLPPWRPGALADVLYAALFAGSAQWARRLAGVIGSDRAWRFPG
jgi:chemotaxis methyl-accepting protein methylase